MSEIGTEMVGEELRAQSFFLDFGREFTPAIQSQPCRARLPLPVSCFAYLAMAVDAAILAGMAACAWAGAFSLLPPAGNTLAQLAAISLLAFGLLLMSGVHHVVFIGSYRRYILRFAQAWCLLMVAGIALEAVLQLGGAQKGFAASAETFLLWWMICGLALAGGRAGLAISFRNCIEKAIIAHDVVLIGATALAAQFIRKAAADGLGIRVQAMFDDDIGRYAPREIANLPVQGRISDFLNYSKQSKIADVVIALPLQDDYPMRNLVRRLSMQPLKISVLEGPPAAAKPPGWCAARSALPGVHARLLQDLPIDFYGRLCKGAFDRLLALFALVLFAPVMIACAVMIKLTSPGSIFYRQRRIGYRNAEFTVYKFRSMHQSACNTGKLTQRGDKRVFGFGRLMRKTSLDELPQLFNVLLGDMSLVGPRPHMPEARAAGQLYSDAVPEYARRHRVKPGITGWAQVNGWRGPTETLYQIEQRVAHDLHYIENWSFWLDMEILVKTCLVGFIGKNAF